MPGPGRGAPRALITAALWLLVAIDATCAARRQGFVNPKVSRRRGFCCLGFVNPKVSRRRCFCCLGGPSWNACTFGL